MVTSNYPLDATWHPLGNRGRESHERLPTQGWPIGVGPWNIVLILLTDVLGKCPVWAASFPGFGYWTVRM